MSRQGTWLGVGRRQFVGYGALLAGGAWLAGGTSRAAAAAEPTVTVAQRRWNPVPPQAPAMEGMATLPDLKLSYWDTGGNGEPVIMLHPATGSSAIWGYQQPVFVKAGYRVISYSRRGYGKSERGPEGAASAASEDLRGLMDVLKVERCHLLGSAAGGFVLHDFALSYPDRLLSLVVACSQGGIAEPEYRAKIIALNAKGFAQMPASFRELGPSYRAANPEGVAAWEVLEHAALNGPRVAQTPTNKVTWDALASIRAPVLAFTGAADLYIPPSLMLEYASHLSNCETAILSESGHSGYWEQPIAFNQLVLDFLRKRPARR